MANSIFNRLNGGNRQQLAPAQGGRRNLAPALLQHIQNFQGNPVEQIQQKLQSGEMSQDQYNQLHRAAEQIAQKMMGYFK
ncbi:MAG: hypothetical protein HFE80_05250 [Clostridiaceae bacterium]|jgi:hypothetical protein|nr:hypothetical protein [Clostridiaceae bacterium]